MTIGQFGALAVQRQHAFFGGIQIGRGGVPIAAAVLEPAAQAQGEELRRQFVMLAIGRIGFDRDRAGPQAVDEGALPLAVDIGIVAALIAQALRAQATDAVAQDGIGQHTGFGEPHGEGFFRLRGGRDGNGRHATLQATQDEGGSGKNALVLRWYCA